MKKLLMIFTAAAFISCTNAQKANFNEEALTHTLASLEGNQVAFGNVIKEHRGQPVVIEIWASWCGDCVKSMPAFKTLQENHPEASYVFISMDRTEEKWREGIEKHNLKGSHYWASEGMKGAFGKSIDLDWIPRYIILDAKGNVVLYRAIETDFDKIDQTLNSLK